MNSTTRTTAPIAPTFTFAYTPHTLHARADLDTSASVNLIAVATSLAGVVIAIIGLILGYVYWKHPRKAASLSIESSPAVNPSPQLPGSIFSVNYRTNVLVQCLVSVLSASSEPQTDPELGRVTSLHSNLDRVELAEEPRPQL